MRCLLDTSILLRLTNTGDAHHATALAAVATLLAGGDVLHTTPQNFVEFQAVATRPTAANGLGLTTAEASRRAAVFEAAFPLLPESTEIYPAWRALVDTLGVSGKQVHDARLTAVCHAHQVTHLLTFNLSHFSRLCAAAPAVVLLDPAKV